MMIRAALLFLLVGSSTVAHAQDVGQTGWLVADAASTRFPGEKLLGVSFTAGTSVTVVFRDGDQLRVTNGDKFGWVASSALTVVPPEGTEPQAPIVVNLTPETAPPQ